MISMNFKFENHVFYCIIIMHLPKVLAALALLAVITQGQLIPPLTVSSSPFGSSLLYQSIASQTCCTDQTITVYGSATIQAAPDTATLSVQITVNADTVSNAIAALTSQINTVLSILTTNGLNSSNYQTSSINVYPNTSWANGVSTVLGQIASQSLQITLPVINSNGSNIGRLIDSIAAVNGIILNGISFDVVNKTEEFVLARSKAFQNAKKKALDYATSLQISLGQILTIIDSSSSAPVVQQIKAPLLSASVANAPTPTTVNVGTIPISYFLEVIYSFGC